MTQSEQFTYIGFWKRLLAFMVDGILITVITMPLLFAIYGMAFFVSGQFIVGFWHFIISYVLPAIAIILFWIARSATPGKMLVKARIVDAKTGGKPSTGQYIGRYFAYTLSLLPLMLGFIWVAFDKRKQGWHDKLAGTLVIKD